MMMYTSEGDNADGICGDGNDDNDTNDDDDKDNDEIMMASLVLIMPIMTKERINACTED